MEVHPFKSNDLLILENIQTLELECEKKIIELT